MTRIVAGEAGGRRLAVPAGRQVRPTSQRAREGLFSALEARRVLAGAVVLDLFAGSGAVGLEALSRGAARALLVESEPRALAVLRANVRALGLPGAVVVDAPAARFLAGPAEPVDLAFLDPPYATGDAEVAALLAALAGRGWLAAGAVVAVERSSRDPAWRWPAGLRPDRSRRYGEATVWYGRAAPAGSGPEPAGTEGA